MSERPLTPTEPEPEPDAPVYESPFAGFLEHYAALESHR